MKLLFCTNCLDIKALTQTRRFCVCRKSSGRYLADMKHARVSGPCEVLGIDQTAIELLPLDSPDVVVNAFYKIRKSQYVERR